MLLKAIEHTLQIDVAMPTQKTAGKIVLFDAVGTVIHTHPQVVHVYHQFGQRFGSALTPPQIAQRFKTARRSLFAVDTTAQQQRAGQLISSDEIEHRLWQQFIETIFDDVADTDELFRQLWEFFALPANWRIYCDVCDCLSELKAAGCVVAIASNFDSRLFPVIDGFNEFQVLDATFCSSRLGFRKPDPAFYRRLENRLSMTLDRNISPDQIVFVGDCVENDYHGPRRQGWSAVWLDRTSGGCSDFTCDKVESLKPLPGLIRSDAISDPLR